MTPKQQMMVLLTLLSLALMVLFSHLQLRTPPLMKTTDNHLLHLGVSSMLHASRISKLLPHHPHDILFTLLIATGHILAFTLLGFYAHLSASNATLLVSQQLVAFLLLLFLEHVLQAAGLPRWSVPSLFRTATICENILWNGFLLPIITMEDRFDVQAGAAHHKVLPTLLLLVLIVFLHQIRIVLPLQHHHPPFQTSSPHLEVVHSGHLHLNEIDLFPTLQTPILAYATFLSKLRSLSRRFSPSSFHQGGLLYYISPPLTLTQIAAHPLPSSLSLGLTLTACTLLSSIWLQFSASSPRKIAQKLKNEHQPCSHADQLEADLVIKKLHRLIPVAAALEALSIAGITVVADLMGTLVSGTDMITLVSNAYQYFQAWHECGVA